MATQAGVEHENLEKTITVILDEYKNITTEKIEAEELKKKLEEAGAKVTLK
jgi:ribosomal protein L7/L12